MTYATADDVAARLGRALTAAEATMVPVLLEDVESLIKSRVTDLDAQVTAAPPTIAQATVVKVEAWAVVRYLRNPDGKRQETIDDYSFTRDAAVSAGLLALTDDEWDELIPSAATSSAFTIRPYGDPTAPWNPSDWTVA